MATDLTRRYNFVTDAAKEAASRGQLSKGAVSQMLTVLDLVRDVSSGSAALFSMSINEDILRHCAGDGPQVGRAGLFALLSLAQAANEMLDQKLEKLFDEINNAVEKGDA